MTFKLGVDIDGTLGNYEQALRAHLIKYGRDPRDLTPMDTYSFVDAGWFKSTKEFHEAHKHFVTHHGLTTLTPMEGARDVLHQLSDEGVRIHIVTSRLLNPRTYGTVIKDTMTWLDMHNIPFNDFSMAEDKTAIAVDLLIDDAPHNVIALRKAGMSVAVFDQPYNQGLTDPRVHNWKEVYSLVHTMM